MTEKDRIVALLEEPGVTVERQPDPGTFRSTTNVSGTGLFAQGTLGLGEAYMDGWWDVADLAEFFNRVLRRRHRRASSG